MISPAQLGWLFWGRRWAFAETTFSAQTMEPRSVAPFSRMTNKMVTFKSPVTFKLHGLYFCEWRSLQNVTLLSSLQWITYVPGTYFFLVFKWCSHSSKSNNSCQGAISVNSETNRRTTRSTSTAFPRFPHDIRFQLWGAVFTTIPFNNSLKPFYSPNALRTFYRRSMSLPLLLCVVKPFRKAQDLSRTISPFEYHTTALPSVQFRLNAVYIESIH